MTVLKSGDDFIEVTVVDHSREPNLRVPGIPAAGIKRLLNPDHIVFVTPDTRPNAPGKTIFYLINDSVISVKEPYSTFSTP